MDIKNVTVNNNGDSCQSDKIISNKSLAIICFIVFLVCFWPVFFSNIFYLTSDEFVPISIAAYFAGMDWSGVTSILDYYSYGYSFILYPLFRVFDDPVLFYKAALTLNCVFAALTVFPANSVLKSLSAKTQLVDGVTSKLILLCAVLYSATVYRANLALGEILLILLFWVLCDFFLRIYDGQSKMWMYPLSGALLMYSYMVHQRFLGVVLAGLLVMFFYLINKKIRIKQFGLFLTTFAILFFLHWFIKPYIQDAIWHGNSIADVNDYTGRLQQLASIISVEGVLNFLRSIFGQLYYLFVSTLSIFAFGLVFFKRHLFASVIRLDRKHLLPDNQIIFLFLAFVFTFVISTIAMTTPSRADHLVYGRYNESLLGPIILCGLLVICNLQPVKKWKLFICLAFIVISSIIFSISIEAFIDRPFALNTSIGMLPYINNGSLNVFLGAGISLLIGLLLVLVGCSTSKKIKNISIVSICVFFIIIAYTALFQTSIPSGKILSHRYEGITEICNQLDDDIPIYYSAYPTYNSNSVIDIKDWKFSTYSFHAPYLQFLLYKNSHINLESISFEKLDEIEKPYYLISPLKDLFFINDDWSFIDAVGDLALLRFDKDAQNHQTDVRLPLGNFYSKNGQEYDDAIISDGSPGHLIFGPFWSVPPLEMEVEFDISVISFDGELGNADITTTIDGEIIQLATIPLASYDIKEGKIKSRLGFESKEALDNIEFRVFTYEGAILSVDAVTVSFLLP